MWIDFRNKNMFRSCIMKLKWTNSNGATSPIFDCLLFSTVCFTWYNLSLFSSLNLSEVVLWCWNCMNDLMKSDLKMSSLNKRTTYHIHNCYLYCCCVSIIIVICICPPGALIWLINLFYSILFYSILFYSILLSPYGSDTGNWY